MPQKDVLHIVILPLSIKVLVQRIEGKRPVDVLMSGTSRLIVGAKAYWFGASKACSLERIQSLRSHNADNAFWVAF